MNDTANTADTGIDMPDVPLPPLRPERGIAAVIPNAIDGTGLPKFQMAAETVHAQYTCRGYVVTLGWVLDPDNGRADAAVTIFPERRFEDAGAWVVTRKGVMKMCDEHNRPTLHCLEEAAKALPILGYDITKTEISRLVDVLMAYVDDLVLMPVPPLAIQLVLQGDPIWDVTVHAKDNRNKVLRETSI